MTRRMVSLISVLLMVSVAAFGQTTGKITGIVTDSDGNPLIGAGVVVDGTSSGAATAEDGQFFILNVPLGRYSVTTTYIGYGSVTLANVEVKGGLTSRLTFELSPEEIVGESVVVVGEKKLVEPSATNSRHSYDVEEIQNAAVRGVTGMLGLVAGVEIENGRVHIRGSREEEVAYSLDGADVKDVIMSGRLIDAIPEALSEVAVEAGGYGAHIGGSNSGVIRQTLRTGSNDFEVSTRVETGNYGYRDLTATIGGPAGPVKYFIAARSKHEDDWTPKYWEGFTINDGELMPSLASGVTPDGDSIAVSFDPDAGIESNWADDLILNGTALVELGALNLRFSGVYEKSNWMRNALPIYSMFNEERLAENMEVKNVFTARANYFVSSNILATVGISMLNRDLESYDGLFGAPESFVDVLGWGDSLAIEEAGMDASAWDSRYDAPENYYVHQFDFQRPSDIRTEHNKSNRKTTGFDLGLTVQRGNHEMRVGFDQQNYSYRTYRMLISAIRNANTAIGNGELTLDDFANETAAAKDFLSLNNRNGSIGYDDFGNETEGDFAGPRQPFSRSFYFNNKYENETNDLIFSFGVRVDQFNLDDWKMVDEANPGYDETNQTILEDQFEKSETKTVIQPRLGLAFPVSDRTVFRLQYGRYAQMPELDLPYASTRYMHLVWGGQNYTPDPMGFNLDPIVTTQYEVGFTQQFSTVAAVDVVVFAKNTTGQIVIDKNREVSVGNTYGVDVDALQYVNGDFSTINGLELTLRTRRIGRVQTNLAYTWSDARGINTEPNSAAGNITQEALAAPTGMIMPLYYERPHKAALSLDYRFGEDEGGLLLSDFGVNLQYRLASGHPYTLSGGGLGQRAADEGALLDDARAREPQEPIGSSMSPWTSYLNVKIDKGFKIGNISLSAFAYIENALDTKNVINVYSRTGNAYDDGFLTDPALSSEILAAQGDTYRTLYENVNLANGQHYRNDFGRDLFGNPRTVRFGISLDL